MSMSPRLLFPCVLGLVTLMAAPVGAQVIDQQQTNDPVCMSGLWAIDLAQSFVPTGLNSVGGGFKMASNSAAAENVTISLWDALPNAGGTMLASGTALAQRSEWVEVAWPLVPVTPGLTYYLLIEGSANGLCVAGDPGNPYTGGHVFTNAGFQAFTAFDFTFRTYTDASPILSLDNVVPGQFMDIRIQGIAQDATAVLLASTSGNGPTSTPFGAVEVSQPWIQSPPFPPDAAGEVNWTSTLPLSLSGQTLYMQVVELEGGGAGELSNAIALPIP